MAPSVNQNACYHIDRTIKVPFTMDRFLLLAHLRLRPPHLIPPCFEDPGLAGIAGLPPTSPLVWKTPNVDAGTLSIPHGGGIPSLHVSLCWKLFHC